MFSESYIIFSVGNIKDLQQWAFPDCYIKTWPDQNCGANQYLGFRDYGADTYIQIIGIIVRYYTFFYLKILCPPYSPLIFPNLFV